MIHLGLLGGVTVERDGARVTGRAAQRHHVALLAILAASPAQTASRDKLIALLWPEQDTPKARHRLSVALHVLRRGLGEGCIVAAGDAVCLIRARVASDVAAFTAAVAEGRLEDAVALYAGPFMDGFFLSGAAEFERWADAEQARLSGLYRVALERLITEAQARHDTAGALRWWRLLASHDPLSAPVAIGFVRALADAGDLPGAVRHARAYAALVHAELELPPDPDLLALVQHLVASSPGAGEGGTAADGSDPGPGAPEGPAGDGRLADPETSAGAAVPHERAPRPQLVPRWVLAAAVVTALALAAGWGLFIDRPDGIVERRGVVVRPFAQTGARAGAHALGVRLADEIARTLGFVPGLVVENDTQDPAAVVEGSIEERQDELLIGARLLDGSSGALQWSGSWRAPRRDRRDFVEEFSLTIADSLRLRVAPYEPKSYTESRRAYDRFLQGVFSHRRYTQEDVWTALQFYREAFEEDPRFALAHAISGNAYIHLTQLGLSQRITFPEAREHVLDALALDSTLAEAHAAMGYIQIWGDRDFEAGERSLRRAIMLYPTLPQARSWYGWFVLRVRGRADQGLASVRRSLEVDPLNTARSDDVERALYAARRYEDVIEQHRVTWSLDSEVARALSDSQLGHAYRELGRYEEAVVEFSALHERKGGRPPVGLALTYARMGRDPEARAILAEHEAAAVESGRAPLDIARMYTSLGEIDTAFHWLEQTFINAPTELLALATDPAFDPLRGDPSFDGLLRRLGLGSGS